MIPVAEVLKGARAKVAQGWTKNASARDARGRQVLAASPKATCWCLAGGVAAITQDNDAVVCALLEAAGHSFEIEDEYDVHTIADERGALLVEWNDEPGRTQAEVLALFDKAIATVSK